MQAEVKRTKSIITENNRDIQKKNKEKENLLAKNNDLELKIKEHSHEVNKLEENCKNAKNRVSKCLFILYIVIEQLKIL